MFDAILLASYGGPEKPEEVDPFLDRILSGKRVSQERRNAVRDRYLLFHGTSPLPEECRRFLTALRKKAPTLKSYQGNLYAAPFMADAVRDMERDDVRSVLVLTSSAFGPGSVCRRYVDAFDKALSGASEKFRENLTTRHVPPFFETDAFCEAVAQSIRAAISDVDASPDRPATLLFTAHSIPTFVANSSRYRGQLQHAFLNILERIVSPTKSNFNSLCGDFPSSRLTLAEEELPESLKGALRQKGLFPSLAFQSRSGAPTTPWLEPDVVDFLKKNAELGRKTHAVIVVPFGFFFENMETIFDLDMELQNCCRRLDMKYVRVQCCGTSDVIVDAVVSLARKEATEFPVLTCSRDACDFSCRLIPRFEAR